MRRMILGVFFLLAACGGDLRNDSGAVNNRSAGSDMRAAREQFLRTRAAYDVIAEFAKSARQDAIDTCLNAYVEDLGPSSPQEKPVYKPSVTGLRAFLSECLADSVPADARGLKSQDMRSKSPGGARSSFADR